MFPNSTQKKYWSFTANEQLDVQRGKANETFIQNCQSGEEAAGSFLTPSEEHQLCQLVEETALKFCQSFDPPLLPTVVYTGFVYFKRFYMHNSVMEHLAKNIMMSCLYLACKVDEFNVSIDEFVRNLKSGTPESNASIILSLEAPIMRQLQYHLIVHCPYRPLEGHFIEMKTLCPNIEKVESMRPVCEEFLWRSLLTDACFLYGPSQIALAAILHSGEKLGYDVHKDYIFSVLCNNDESKAEILLPKLRECVQIVTSVQPTSKESASFLQSRVQQFMTVMDEITAQRAKRKLDHSDTNPGAKRMKSMSTESTEGSGSDDE